MQVKPYLIKRCLQVLLLGVAIAVSVRFTANYGIALVLVALPYILQAIVLEIYPLPSRQISSLVVVFMAGAMLLVSGDNAQGGLVILGFVILQYTAVAGSECWLNYRNIFFQRIKR